MTQFCMNVGYGEQCVDIPDFPTIPEDPPTTGETDPDPDAGVTLPDGSTGSATAMTPPLVGVKQMAWQSQPYKCLWCVRTDGLLVSLTYDKDEDVWAWARHPMTNGSVYSVAVIPSATSEQDEVWLVVQRTIGIETRFYVERMTARIEPADLTDKSRYTFPDCSLRYSGAPATHFSGCDHLEGQTCRVWADGSDAGDVVIAGGAFDLTTPASEVAVGIHSGALVISLPAARLATDRQIIGEVAIKFAETLGGSVGPFAGQADEIPFRDTDTPMDDSPPMVNALMRVHIAGSHDDLGVYTIAQDTAGPMTILAVFPDYKAA